MINADSTGQLSHSPVDAKLDRPIFVVGVGRSGSSIFHQMFAEHPRVAWLSHITASGGDHARLLHWILAASDWPLAGTLLKKRYGAGENYHFWERYRTGFSEPYRDLCAGDATERDKRVLPSVLARIPTSQRNRLLVKLTGWPRVGFLHEVFPDAKFIHIKRDPRSVINSLISVDFWSGWRGPQNWRWGPLTPAQEAEWERFDRSFIALAGIQLEIMDAAMRRAQRTVAPENFVKIEYGALCAEPLPTFRRVIDFCELPWPPAFEQALRRYRLHNTNDKWRRELTTAQQEIVEYFADKLEQTSQLGDTCVATK